MIDVNQITTTLRGLPDRALQQYAMMHKGDPYILSLAVSESNQRKQLRAAGQGQAGAMPQPKVADAAIASMAQQQPPENQGIAQIPTPNVQNMADGGIAGYEDDEEGMATGGMGGMFNFAQQSEPVVRMAGGGHIPRYQGVPTEDGGDGSMVDEFKGVDDQIAANMERQKLMGAFDEYSKPIPKPKKGSKADKKEDEAKKEDTAKKPALPAIPTYTPKTAEQIKTATNLMAAPELAEIKESYKPFAEQFAQDRSRIEGREKNAVSDALIRAGLATMAGKSQFALQNIGEGGLQGLNAYQEGQKANEASRRALTQSEMLMSQAQRAEGRGAKADAISLFNQAEQAQQAATQFGQKAQEIANTKEYQEGALLVQNRNADAAMISARASQSRANALNAAGGKGALTESQLARVRDSARDNITKDANFPLSQLKAERAAKAAGKPFDATTWLNGLIDTEVERMLANTSRASTIQPAPTGGKLGSGTFNLGSGWGQPEVVTPKK